MKKNRTVKICISAMLTLVMMGMSCIASEYKLSYEKGNIVVSGITDSFGDTVTLTVYPNGQDSFVTNKLLALLEDRSSAENGEIKFEFAIRDDREDISEIDAITIYIREDSKNTVTELSANYSAGGLNSFISSIRNNNTADNVKSLFDASENTEIMNQLGISCYYEITSENQKKNLTEMIVKCWDVSRLTTEEIYKAFSKAYGVSELNAKGNAKKALEIIDPVFEGISYNEIKAENLLKWLEDTAEANSYKTVEAFEIEYVKENVLYIINNEKAVNLYDTINSYASVLEINGKSEYKNYAELKGNARYAASDALEAELYNSKAKTVEDLLNKLKRACEAASSGKKNGSGGSGNGGGGSSGGNASGGFTAKSLNEEQKTEAFTDLDNVLWAKAAIEGLAAKGIVNGVGDGRFDPDARVSREQFVKMLVGAAGIPVDNGLTLDFKDTDKTAWSYKYIAAAVKCGIVKGISDKEFGMGITITRQDAAVMAYRTAEAVSISLKAGKNTEFEDMNEISDYAKEAVNKMSAAGIINGIDGNHFAPLENCTRAQAAKIIWQMFFG